MTPLKGRKSWTAPLIFVVLFATVAGWFYHDTITEFPSFIHGWTQSDRYALALGFLQNGFDFFHPQTYNLLTEGGITAVDFPLADYLSAVIMAITGKEAPVVFRVVTLLFSAFGLWHLYRWARRTTHSPWRAALVVGFIGLAPAYVYYQAGFLPTVPALAFAFFGYGAFFRYLELYERKYLWQAMLGLTVAALIRLPFSIFLFAALLQMVVYWRFRKLPAKHLLWLIGGMTAVSLYFLWNRSLSETYGTMFLAEFLPFTSWDHFMSVLDQMSDYWMFEYFSVGQFALLSVAVLLLAWTAFRNFSALNARAQQGLLQFGIATLGATLYFFLMGQQYYNHDYYFLDTFYLPIVLLLIPALTLAKAEKGWRRPAEIGVVIALLGFFMVSATTVQDERYTVQPWDGLEESRQLFEGADAWLDSVGVAREDTMLVLDARSTNVPLILMRRKGYTLLHTKEKFLEAALEQPHQWVVAIQPSVLADVYNHWNEAADRLTLVASNGRISLFEHHPQSRRPGSYLDLTSQGHRTQGVRGAPNAPYCLYQPLLPGGSSPFTMTPDDEFSPMFDTLAAGFDLNDGGIAVMATEAAFAPDQNHQLVCVFSVFSPDGELKYYKDFLVYPKVVPADEWSHFAFEFKLPAGIAPTDRLRGYFQNRNRTNLKLRNGEGMLFDERALEEYYWCERLPSGDCF